MKVEPYDGIEGIVRGVVLSETKPGERYFVDLTQHNGFGLCSCDQFNFRISPALAGKNAGDTSPARCKHLEAYRNFSGQQLLDTYIQKTKEKRIQT